MAAPLVSVNIKQFENTSRMAKMNGRKMKDIREKSLG
jgi:hypothetical protein